VHSLYELNALILAFKTAIDNIKVNGKIRVK
jgi:hypothetical protein